MHGHILTHCSVASIQLCRHVGDVTQDNANGCLLFHFVTQLWRKIGKQAWKDFKCEIVALKHQIHIQRKTRTIIVQKNTQI